MVTVTGVSGLGGSLRALGAELGRLLPLSVCREGSSGMPTSLTLRAQPVSAPEETVDDQ